MLQKASDAYKVWHGLLPHIPRLTRYTLGAKIDALFIETVELILHAGYSSREMKLAIVLRACTKLDALKYFLQITWELKALDTKHYARISEPLAEVGKMLGGWKKQLQTEAPLP
ncbi:MAG: four helix bundle protein [bacterium]